MELRECPFCGATEPTVEVDKGGEHYCVTCRNCYCDTFASVNLQEVVDAWNRRTQPPQQPLYVPLPDGVYETQHAGNQVKVSGEWLTVREKNIFDPTDAYVADAALPDNIRLCWLQDAQPPTPQPVPDTVRDTISSLLESAIEGTKSTIRTRKALGLRDFAISEEEWLSRYQDAHDWITQKEKQDAPHL